MSKKLKQIEAKKAQGYEPIPLSIRCRECRFFEEIEKINKNGMRYKKLRCGLGGFLVKPNTVCAVFQPKKIRR